MKYIRTKDGRIIDLKTWSRVELDCVNAETREIKKDICYQRYWFEQHGDCCEYKTEHISHNNQVLKEANTIEELCDAVVRIKNDRLPLCFNIPTAATYKWGNDYLKIMMEGKNIIEIYGAIWTDKGLTYVAKINEKGELELI